MPVISLVVAMDEAGGLGRDNQLLCHLPADLQHFKKITLNKPVIMGRKTFESIGRLLPQRLNIILSRQEIKIDGAIVVKTLSQAIAEVQDAPEIMIIGGADIFQQAVGFADQIYMTLIHHVFDADVFFPEVDWGFWSLVESKKYAKDEKNRYDMTFIKYKTLTYSGHV